jgi:hypothetical protein
MSSGSLAPSAGSVWTGLWCSTKGSYGSFWKVIWDIITTSAPIDPSITIVLYHDQSNQPTAAK